MDSNENVNPEGEMDFSKELFGDAQICPTCGDWGCLIHFKHEEDKDAAAEVAGFIDFSLLQLIKEHDADLAERVSEDDEKAIVNLDGENKYVEEDEIKPEDVWELPTALDVQVSGQEIHWCKDSKDEDVADEKASAEWKNYDVIKDDMMTLSTGATRSFRQFRAKKEATRSEIIREAAMKIVPRLERQIKMALEAEARVARERNLRRGSIDAGRAHALVTSGKSDIFAQKANTKAIHAAVQIVLDDSGSMQECPNMGKVYVTDYGRKMSKEQFLNSKYGCSAVLAYAIAEVCNRLKIPCEVLSFQESFWDDSNDVTSARWRNCYSILYKSFDENWMAVRDRMGNYCPAAGTDRPYEAAQFAARRLLQRKEEIRVMFFLTDGNDYNTDVDKLGDFAGELKRKADIRMIGVGILTSHLKKYMKEKAEIIERLEGLSDAVFGRLAKLIHPM